MWNEAKQQQLDALQSKAQEGTLTEADQHALDQLIYELEQMEWNALRPALERYESLVNLLLRTNANPKR